MTAAVVGRGEKLIAIAFLLLNEDVEGLQLLLHVLDGISDEFRDPDDVMIGTAHRVLLTCNHGLLLEIVI